MISISLLSKSKLASTKTTIAASSPMKLNVSHFVQTITNRCILANTEE
ncbi:unnamed protein product [Brassica oleracea var. botrytis]